MNALFIPVYRILTSAQEVKFFEARNYRKKLPTISSLNEIYIFSLKYTLSAVFTKDYTDEYKQFKQFRHIKDKLSVKLLQNVTNLLLSVDLLHHIIPKRTLNEISLDDLILELEKVGTHWSNIPSYYM